MKILVIGGVAGGASAAARARRLDPLAEIIVFDRGDYVSYSNCSLPYYLGGVVEDADDLIMMDPGSFKRSHDIDVRVRSEVLSIDRKKKEIEVSDLNTGERYREKYDKLILSPGASPIMPKSIKGIDGKNVFSVRSVNDVVRIREALAKKKNARVLVCGGGFIGVEVAENLCLAGYKVSLVEGLGQILQPYDEDMVQILHKELYDHGVQLLLNTTLKEIGAREATIETEGEEKKLRADFVIMAIGVSPETKLAQDAGLAIGETRGIKVNDRYQTSDRNIYALGDAIEVWNFETGLPQRLALAGPAQRQARIAINHIYGIKEKGKGVLGSSCIRVFGLNAASTGLNEKAARAAELDFDSVLVFPSDRVGIMPGANYMAFKLLFEKNTGKLLGAQAIGTGEADKRVNVVAALISKHGTIEDLKDLELCYAPLFSTAKDVVNIAALVAENVQRGVFRQVHLSEVRSLAESGAYIIDVRERGEFKAGHLKGAHNIPLSELRSRLDEIPKDIPVYLHCRTSQRSYYALCALKGRGFDNLFNISGSFLGISLYEYFKDQTTGRKKILSAYNFN